MPISEGSSYHWLYIYKGNFMKYGFILFLSFAISGCGTFSGGSDEFDAIYNTSSALLNKDRIEKHCSQTAQELREACRTKKKQQVNAIQNSINKHIKKNDV